MSDVDVHVILAVTEHGLLCPACRGASVRCPICFGHVHGRRTVAPDLGNRVARIQAKLPVPSWDDLSPEGPDAV